MMIHNNIKIYLHVVFVVGLCLGLSASVVGQSVNIAPLATIDDAGLNYASYAGWQSNQSFITDGNIGTYQQEDYQVAFDNASGKLLTFNLDQEYTNIRIKFYNSTMNNTSGINLTTLSFFNTETFASGPSLILNESDENEDHVIELSFITDNFTSGYDLVFFQFYHNDISFREIEIYGTPVSPSTGDPTPPVVEHWQKEATGTGIFYDSGDVRIGNSNRLPLYDYEIDAYESPSELRVNGHTTFNVGRGEVYLENNSLDNASGAGLTLRTSQNPGFNAPIFSIRSSGNIARLWVGQDFSSFGANDVYFGGENAEREEQNTNKYKGVLKRNGRIGIGTINPERALHVRGGVDGMLRIDRNIYNSSIMFGNYESDWSSVKSSGVVSFQEDGSFLIKNNLGNVEGPDGVDILKIDTEYDVNIPNTLSVGKDAVRIDGAIAHFDGRVYISEEDGKVDPSRGESTTENGFEDMENDIFRDFLLWIEGGVVSNELAILSTKEWWPDYVFNETYELMPIHELKAYVKTHKHLPHIPSAKDVKKKGLDLAGMTIGTLKTVEEMTLYVIDHDKDLDSLQTESESRISYLKQLLNKYEN